MSAVGGEEDVGIIERGIGEGNRRVGGYIFRICS